MTTVRLARRAFVAASLLAVAVFVPLLLAGSDSEAQTPFTPTYYVILVDPTAGASSDIKTNFLLPAPNYNFAGLVGFTPPQFAVAKGTDIPIGAVVARLTSTATLGLINDGCFTSAVIPFTFLNASVNPADTIDPLPAGTEDRLKNIGGLLTESDATVSDRLRLPAAGDPVPFLAALSKAERTRHTRSAGVTTFAPKWFGDMRGCSLVADP